MKPTWMLAFLFLSPALFAQDQSQPTTSPAPPGYDTGSALTEAPPAGSIEDPLPPLPPTEVQAVTSTPSDPVATSPAPESVVSESVTADPAPSPAPVVSEMPPDPAPLPSASSTPAPSSQPMMSARRRVEEIKTPLYQRVKPNWAIAVSASPKALGSGSVFENHEEVTWRGATLVMDWQPEALQGAGVFALGVSASMYSEPAHDLTEATVGVWSFGAQAKYQFRYFDEQFLVPYAGVAYDMINYTFTSESSGRVNSIGGIGGLALLMNVFEPSSAAAFYSDWGVARTYLFAEFKGYSGTDDTLDLGGMSLFAGFRFEY